MPSRNKQEKNIHFNSKNLAITQNCIAFFSLLWHLGTLLLTKDHFPSRKKKHFFSGVLVITFRLCGQQDEEDATSVRWDEWIDFPEKDGQIWEQRGGGWGGDTEGNKIKDEKMGSSQSGGAEQAKSEKDFPNISWKKKPALYIKKYLLCLNFILIPAHTKASSPPPPGHWLRQEEGFVFS